MNEITINTALLLEICALIIAVGGAGAWLIKMIKPFSYPIDHAKNTLNEHGQRLEDGQKILDSHEATLVELTKEVSEIKEDNIHIMSSLVILLRHAETNNNTGEVRKEHEDLEKYLIKRG